MVKGVVLCLALEINACPVLQVLSSTPNPNLLSLGHTGQAFDIKTLLLILQT